MQNPGISNVVIGVVTTQTITLAGEKVYVKPTVIVCSVVVLVCIVLLIVQTTQMHRELKMWNRRRRKWMMKDGWENYGKTRDHNMMGTTRSRDTTAELPRVEDDPFI